MSEIRDRATEMLPSVVLTLLSMIQALALELLWSKLIGSPHLWRSGSEAWLGWLQVFVLVLGFIQIWLFYVSIVLRFRWTPRVKDTLVPLAIGVLEFALIETCDPDRLGLWMVLLAAISVVAMVNNQAIFVAARAHPDNREFFDRLERSSWSDFLPAAAAIGTMFLFGVWLTRDRGLVPACAGLLLAAVFLSYQLHLTWRYWHFAFDPAPDGTKDPDHPGPRDRESLES